ncbi:MAG: hypothetical protein ABSA47_14545 [Verrucomicrobiota bacterium]|jgi:hypothetical protein
MKIYDRSLKVIPSSKGSGYELRNLTRIEWLEMAMRGRVMGEFKASIIDLEQSLEGPEIAGNPPVPPEVASWISDVYGKAVLIQALVPRPFPPEWGFAPIPQQGEILPV